MANKYMTYDFGVNAANFDVEDARDLCKKAWNDGVTSLVCLSNHPSEWSKVLNLATELNDNVVGENPPSLFFTLGVNARNARFFTNDKHAELWQLLQHASEDEQGWDLVALTTGLDFTVPHLQAKENETQAQHSARVKATHNERKKTQFNVLKRMLGLAKKFNLKLHLQLDGGDESFRALLDAINEMGLADRPDRGVIHSFVGTSQHALTYINTGFKLGITGVLYNGRRNVELLKALQNPKVKAEHLLVASNTPYDSVWIRSRQNEPPKESNPSVTGNIVYRLARVMNVDETTLGRQIYKNSMAFLGTSQ